MERPSVRSDGIQPQRCEPREPDGSYRLTPYDPSFEAKMAKMAKVEDIASRSRNTLHVLAK